ncbi:MAG: DNA mismatch repair protein MutS [Candidatus Fimadaptatus sp.]|nr:DNA mismatch repair protein MutS [Candidatus Fimadaptatus sp.]
MGVTPMMQQYLNIKKQNGDAILFFRLGDFYEMFFDDAITASRELDLTLTGKDCGLKERAPMCGVPYHAVEGYVAKLIKKGYRVAICEQMEDPKLAKGLVERQVIRVITPGTVIEQAMLDDRSNNFLVSVCLDGDAAGLALCDVSTGEFSIYQIAGALDQLMQELSRISPSEIIANAEARRFKTAISAPVPLGEFDDEAYLEENAEEALKAHFPQSDLNQEDIRDLDVARRAAGALIQYLTSTQKNSLQHIDHIALYRRSAYMTLDPTARRNLELTESLRDRKRRGSLLWLLDKTCTTMGSRMLKLWIEQPLLNERDITARQDAIEFMLTQPMAADELREKLKQVCDLERMLSRLAYGTLNARDCLALRRSFEVLPDIARTLDDCHAEGLLSHARAMICDMDKLCRLLTDAISEDAPVTLREGGLFKDGFNEQLDAYRTASREGKHWLSKLEADEREKTGIKNLKIGFNRVFGYYIEVTKSFADKVPYRYVRKQTLAGAERYTTQELKDIEDKVLGSEEKAVQHEYNLFQQLREAMLTQIDRIKSTASALKQLDCILSLTQSADEYGYVRPKLNREHRLFIRDGRHPVVEQALTSGESFVPNDTDMDLGKRMMIITGPNMAGKSTYMRQVALIVLMAQIGSFVPAHEADICLTDRIFTRIGASDDLYGGQSTFMVEMSELSQILAHATADSLIILDEIGRGTSTFDGMSIAWATVEHIADMEKCGALCLFATHYHELGELEGKIDGVVGCCITAKERGDTIIFLRKLQPGGADKSYGVAVAALAGLPADVTARAREIMAKLEVAEINKTSISANILSDGAHGQTQLTMANFESMAIVDELCDLDVMSMSPIDALNKLYLLREKARNTLK